MIGAVNKDTWCTKPHILITVCDTPPSEETHRSSKGVLIEGQEEDGLSNTTDDQVQNAFTYVRNLLPGALIERISEVALPTSCI